MNISIDTSRCKRCGLCGEVCPARIFEQSSKKDFPAIVRAEFCISCGHCAAVCPVDAVKHAAFPEEMVFALDKAAMPSPGQMRALLRSRRSMRVFSDMPVTHEELEALLDAARMAPSAHNYQDVRYMVICDQALLSKIKVTTVAHMQQIAKQLRNPLTRTLARCFLGGQGVQDAMQMLPEFDLLGEALQRGLDPILHNAPCVIIAYAKRGMNYPEANAALALHNATLMAHAMGLGSFLLGYVVAACKRGGKVAGLLGIPQGHEVYGGLALGHLAVSYPKGVLRRPLDVIWK